MTRLRLQNFEAILGWASVATDTTGRGSPFFQFAQRMTPMRRKPALECL